MMSSKKTPMPSKLELDDRFTRVLVSENLFHCQKTVCCICSRMVIVREISMVLKFWDIQHMQAKLAFILIWATCNDHS